MLDVQKIKSACENDARISKTFVDEFLIYFIAKNEGLEEKIFRQFGNFRNVIIKMSESWLRMLVSQLIAHRTFKKDGLAARYVRHAEMRYRK